MNYVLIEFDEKEKKILFDFNALSLFEDVYGESLISAMGDETKFGFKMIRTLYYVGMKHGRDAGLTQNVVGNMIYEKMTNEGWDLEDLMKPILKALEKSGIFKDLNFDIEEDDEEKN